MYVLCIKKVIKLIAALFSQINVLWKKYKFAIFFLSYLQFWQFHAILEILCMFHAVAESLNLLLRCFLK